MKLVLTFRNLQRAALYLSAALQLESLRTQSGAGLRDFLHKNSEQFAPEVNEYIEQLMNEVVDHVEG
ncbi:MAG: hypothetical protein R3C03_12915 [Pirellulaceae bacterium]